MLEVQISDINECYTRPCKNGAQCINNQGSFKCICPPDYTGPLCETGIQSSFSIMAVIKQKIEKNVKFVLQKKNHMCAVKQFNFVRLKFYDGLDSTTKRLRILL
jgi:hypothetical protein